MEESGSNVHRQWAVEQEDDVVASFQALVHAFEEADWTMVDLHEDPPARISASFVKPMDDYCASALMFASPHLEPPRIRYDLYAPYSGSDDDNCDRQ